ncbi:MAG TPA: hemerythrin domain-containing protein [Polyangiaceae bacterium]|jgi:hemerythrin-like domain-containing protein
MPEDPVLRLGNTHRRMEEELRALETAAASGDRQGIDLGLDFFASAAKRHHEDEEASLFPRLRGDPTLVPLLDALTAEHREHEEARRHLEGLVRDGADAVAIAASAARFAAMLRAHIEREDRELLPAAEGVLDPETREAVAAEMRERRRAR